MLKFCSSFRFGDTLIEVAMAIGIFSLVAIAVVAVVNGGNSDIQTTLESTMARNEIDTQAEALRFIQSAYIAERTDSSEQDKSGSKIEGPYKNLWKAITRKAISANDPSYNNKVSQLTSPSASTCSELYQDGSLLRTNGFILNTRSLNTADSSSILMPNSKLTTASLYPRLIFSGTNSGDLLISGNNSLYSAEGIYVIAVQDKESIVVSNGGTKKGSAFYDFYIKTCWYGSGTDIPSTISTIVRLYDPDVEVADSQLIDYALIFYDGGILNTPPIKKQSEKTQALSFTLNKDDILNNKPGKTFLGWSDINNQGNIENQCKDAIMPNPNPLGLNSISAGVDLKAQNPVKTVSAVWQCKYTLTYDGNTTDGTLRNMPPIDSKTLSAATYVPKITSVVPTRNSWKFYGWSTSKSSSPTNGNLLKAGNNGPTLGISWTGHPQSSTLYAVWGHTYTLTYNKNVACTPSNMPSNKTIITSQATNYSLIIDGKTPYCEGYKFKGWSTNPNDKSTNPSLLQPGRGTVTFNSTKPTQTITLYGIWIKDSRDTAFLLDVTGSMSSFIRNNSGTIRRIVQTVLDGGYQAAFYSYERSSWINCDFGVCNTSNISFLNNIRTSGGTENVYGALINVMANGHWVSGALNTIIVLTDENGNDQGRIEEVINRAKQIDMVNIYVFYNGWTSAYNRVTSGTGGRVLFSTWELEQLIEELKRRS